MTGSDRPCLFQRSKFTADYVPLLLGRVNTLTSFHWFHIFFLNTKLLKGSTVSHRENVRFPHSCSNPLIFPRAGKLLYFTYCYCRASFLCDNGCVDGLLCDGRGAVFGSAWHRLSLLQFLLWHHHR